MECVRAAFLPLCALLLLGGPSYLLQQCRRGAARYGRYTIPSTRTLSAPCAWFLQELPAFLVPVLMTLTTHRSTYGRTLLLCTFTLHYFHRTFIFSYLTRGRPVPVNVVAFSFIFCSINGFLQSHSLLHCSDLDLDLDPVSCARAAAGLCLFVIGMSINIHSDHILRNLRKPGEHEYRIPRGGLFELVSGANFLGEIVEWLGFAVAAWTLPAFSFALFTACSIGPRALEHHRYYLEKFKDYPRSRKALIPFIL